MVVIPICCGSCYCLVFVQTRQQNQKPGICCATIKSLYCSVDIAQQCFTNIPCGFFCSSRLSSKTLCSSRPSTQVSTTPYLPESTTHPVPPVHNPSCWVFKAGRKKGQQTDTTGSKLLLCHQESCSFF